MLLIHIQYGLDYNDSHRQGCFKALVARIQGLTLRAHDKELHAPHLGYSKYADAEVLGHACSVLAAFAVTATVGDRNPLSVLVLPWVVVAGGGLQLLCGSVAFARGKTFESTVFTLYGVMWAVWGLTRYGGLYGETRGFHVAVGIMSFMLVKKQAEDRPMSLWISSIKQLEPVRHLLSPLLLDFMEAAWPSSISMVIPRGPWMDTFGLGDAAKHIGTPQSIAIRNPDCSVATHLINMVGPIAVTSANPTGEADTTHHNQVLQIFEEVQMRHRHGQTNPAFEDDVHLSDIQRDKVS
ncbi:hypothetical protein F7725_023368 [Dissostichus mawsoni]|uniref:Threonylcarbamoyl-AMP synthase n=1 Tax=Dissostichus mawsoni TaxID=36200 RepID=A0A7J5Z1I3_DISMA|nr:hypothetical protein F7725_023368 [Dissostichus mawsoni]